MEQIRKKSPLLRDLEKEGKILIVGGFYDIETGEVSFYD
jgi:carbonic anhydrase